MLGSGESSSVYFFVQLFFSFKKPLKWEGAKMKTKYLIMVCVAVVSLFIFTSAYAQDDDLSLIGNRLDVLAFLKAYLNNPLGLKGPQPLTQAAAANVITVQTAVAAPAPQPPPLRMTTVTVDGKKTTTVTDIMDRTYVNGLLTHAKVSVAEVVGGLECYYTVDTSITYDTQTQTAKVTQITSSSYWRVTGDTTVWGENRVITADIIEIYPGVTLTVTQGAHVVAGSITLDNGTGPEDNKRTTIKAGPVREPPPGDTTYHTRSMVIAGSISSPAGATYKGIVQSTSNEATNGSPTSPDYHCIGYIHANLVEAKKVAISTYCMFILGGLTAPEAAEVKAAKAPIVTQAEIPFSIAPEGEMPALLVLQGSVDPLPAGVQMVGTMITKQDVTDPIKK